MKPYKNLSGKSGVSSYDYNATSITVMFSTGSIYVYTDKSADVDAIETLKRLADEGSGLNSYISTNKPNFESKR